MDFNTGAWTGMDDDVLRRIYSFTLMTKIPMLVDKEKFNKMFYCRENVCAVMYIQKEYVCCQIRANILVKTLSISSPHDNQQDFELACTSLHDSDESISEDGADQKLSSVAIVSQSILQTSIVKHMIFKDYGVEITKVTRVKSSAMNVQESKNYLTVLIKVKKLILQMQAQMKIQ